MTRFDLGHAIRLSGALALALGIALPSEVLARGGGGYAGGGHAGIGHSGGVYGGGYRYGGGNGVRFGARNGFQGRLGVAGNRRNYYPSGGFGAPGYYSGGAAAPYAATAGSVASPTSFYTRSEIIRRGPAFGEPGYVSRPVIYRLVPSESRRPGTRRFKVERLDF